MRTLRAAQPQGMNDARSIGDVVNRVREIAEGRDTVSVGDLVDEFGDHSFAPLMLIIALIGMTPVGAIPTAPTILGLCIGYCCGPALAAGREMSGCRASFECRSVSSRKLKQGSDKTRQGRADAGHNRQGAASGR